MQQAATASSLHITKGGNPHLLLAPCSAIATTLTSSLPLELRKSILVIQALTTLNRRKLRKQHRLMSPERKNIYIC